MSILFVLWVKQVLKQYGDIYKIKVSTLYAFIPKAEDHWDFC